MKEAQEQECSLYADVLTNGSNFSWLQYAERNGLVSSDAANLRWKRYARRNGLPITLKEVDLLPKPPYPNFELRNVKKGKNGETINESWSKQPPDQPDFDVSGVDVTGGTFNPYGRPWLRFDNPKPPLEELTEHQRQEFEARRTELEKLPGSHSYQNAIISGKHENWIIIGCAHIPGHNKRIWNGLLKYISTHDIDGVILAGDALDLKSLSSHDKGQVRDVNLWQEYEAAVSVFAELESALKPTCKKVFLYGNHEDRFNKILKDAENSRFGDALLSPERALRLDERGWQVLRNWKEDYIALTPELDVFHGNRLGDNPAQKELKDCMLSGRSVIFFHTHRFGVASNGKIAAYNCGMMGDIDNEVFNYVSWRIRQHWQNGFCTASILDDGSAFVNPVRCSKNGFVLDGNFYGG